MRLRRLTADGLEAFRTFLRMLRSDPSAQVPDFLNDPALTSLVSSVPEFTPPRLTTKREAADFLIDLLSSLDGPALHSDEGLWSWLAALFFEDLCPVRGGRRKPVADAHYILEATTWNRRYRHLLLTPYRVRQLMPEHNRIVLDSDVSVHGDLTEQLVSRLHLLRLPGVAHAVDMLYFDPHTGKPKRGILPKAAKPGDFRNRFPVRINQLRRTYDVAVLNGPQLVELLGREFRPRS